MFVWVAKVCVCVCVCASRVDCYRLLSPKPLVTFELPADVVSSGRDSSKRREPAPSQLLLQQALGLLHLGQLLWYQPRPEWWAATLCQLGDEIPQVG